MARVASSLLWVLLFLLSPLTPASASTTPRSDQPLAVSISDPSLLAAPPTEIQRAQQATRKPAEEAPLSLLQEPTTTLEVAILSSPYAVLDHDDPNGNSGPVPQVFLVAAVITNTGAVAANNVRIDLNYNPEPANNWILLPGEIRTRALDRLRPGETYHAYWFARYPGVANASHTYTVTASAANARSVSASKSVQTTAYRSTGNSALLSAQVQATAGVTFTVVLTYDLGQNPGGITFSPVGNADFNPLAYRLVANRVRLYDKRNTQSATYHNRVYFSVLPNFAEYARVEFVFLPVTGASTRMCPYAGIHYDSQPSKYANQYCRELEGTVISVTGEVQFRLSQQASAEAVGQGQTITYTVRYTSTSTAVLEYVWIWAKVPSGVVSIISNSANPAATVTTSTERVAWYLGTVSPGSSGELSFAARVDGGSDDLDDGTLLVSNAYFGIEPGTLPASPALTATTTTVVQAPRLMLAHGDGSAVARPGDLLTYTLAVTNNGSLTATNVVITDVLPVGVTYESGDAKPQETIQQYEQTLVWQLESLPAGEHIQIVIPVHVGQVADGTVLENLVFLRYANPNGYVFAMQTAQSTTSVVSPRLEITKRASDQSIWVGDLLTYTLAFTNTGSGAAYRVVVTDVLPAYTSFHRCSPQDKCRVANGTVQWDIGTLDAGESGTVILVVKVEPGLQEGRTIVNERYGVRGDLGSATGGPVAAVVNWRRIYIPLVMRLFP